MGSRTALLVALMRCGGWSRAVASRVRAQGLVNRNGPVLYVWYTDSDAPWLAYVRDTHSISCMGRHSTCIRKPVCVS